MAQGNKQWREFVDELKERAGSQPSSPMFRVRLGNALERIGELEAALAEYRAAAEAFLRTGFARHARSVYRMILDRAPNDREARRGYARALKDCFDDPSASDELGDALQVPNMPSASDVAEAQTANEPPSEDEYWTSVKTQDPGTLFEGEDFAVVRPGTSDGSNGANVGAPTAPTADSSAPAPPPPPQATVSAPAPAAPQTQTPAASEGTPAPSAVPASVADRRRAPRVPWDVETHLSDGTTLYIGNSTNLSATGVFVEGITTIEPGTLVDLTFFNATEGWKGTGRGQVARIVNANPSRNTEGGIGIALLWVDPPTEHWMLRHIEQSLGRLADEPAPQAAELPELPAQPGRATPRVNLVAPARVVSREFEAVGWSLDLSEGGAFLAVPQLFYKGDQVEVSLWLERDETPITVTAVIVDSRKATQTQRSGVAVRFTELDEDLVERIRVAVRTAGAPTPIV